MLVVDLGESDVCVGESVGGQGVGAGGALIEQHSMANLILAPLIGRGALLGLFLNTPYVRSGCLLRCYWRWRRRGSICAWKYALAVVVQVVAVSQHAGEVCGEG